MDDQGLRLELFVNEPDVDGHRSYCCTRYRLAVFYGNNKWRDVTFEAVNELEVAQALIKLGKSLLRHLNN